MAFSNFIPSFVERRPGATFLTTIALITGVVLTVNKTTPTAAIINEKLLELKTSSGTGLHVTGSGALTASGKILSQRTTDLGWSVQAGANAACNTTCTHACVFGVNTAATEADIVACTDATADECLCAGGS